MEQLLSIKDQKCYHLVSRLRLGMTNPPYILDHLEEMAEILNENFSK